MPNMAMNP